MSNKNLSFSMAICVLTTTSQMIFTSVFSDQVKADTLISEVSGSTMNFKPTGPKQPINTASGASRGNGENTKICSGDSEVVKTKVTTLLPKNNYGLTVQGRPKLFVYVPKTTAKKAFFSVQDAKGNDHFDQEISLPSQAGIMQIDLKNAPELATGTTYKWSFVLMCNNKMLPDSPTVEGYIKRVEANNKIKNVIGSDNKLNQAKTYAQEGIWYETVAILAQLKLDKPAAQNVNTSWESLLTDVGLSKINQAKIMP